MCGLCSTALSQLSQGCQLCCSEPGVALTLWSHPVLKQGIHLGWANIGIGRDFSGSPGCKQHQANKAINAACFGNFSTSSSLQQKIYEAVDKLAWHWWLSASQPALQTCSQGASTQCLGTVLAGARAETPTELPGEAQSLKDKVLFLTPRLLGVCSCTYYVYQQHFWASSCL